MRVIFRFLGFWLLAGAFIALVLDGTRSIADARVVITPLGETWHALHSNSLQLLQPAIERHITPLLWDPVMLAILNTPTWVVVGLIGVAFALIGHAGRADDNGRFGAA